MKIYFRCHVCSKKLKADLEQAGKHCLCTKCKARNKIPVTTDGAPEQNHGARACPFCGEFNFQKDQVCKHCSRALVPMAKVLAGATLEQGIKQPLMAIPSCYLRQGGKTSGPFTPKKLKAYYDAGKLQPTDEVSEKESGPWRSVTTVKGIEFKKDVGANSNMKSEVSLSISPGTFSLFRHRSEMPEQTPDPEFAADRLILGCGFLLLIYALIWGCLGLVTPANDVGNTASDSRPSTGIRDYGAYDPTPSAGIRDVPFNRLTPEEMRRIDGAYGLEPGDIEHLRDQLNKYRD